MITQKTISEVFETVKIEEVVNDFVNLKRRGSNMIGLCPFHNEKTPSFSVSPSKNIYKCFGCSKGGSPVQFVMEHENFTYPEAIRYLAEKYNIEIEETEKTDEQKAAQLEQDSFYIVNKFANDFFINQLFNDPIGRTVGLSYFKERGFREHTIKKFELGFAPNQKTALVDLAKSKGYNLTSLGELGLINQYGGDFFKDRVMFPIHGLSGKPIAFAGRALTTADKKTPKYINSPETKIYVKSKVLYGLYFARQAVRKKDNCYLVEGYTDVISLHQAGIENVVASSGTALTKDQIKAIQRYTPNITVLYDGDSAGVKAALRGLDLILAEGMNVKLVMLPEGEDPDSFVQSQGQENFEKFLSENAKDFILFKAELLEAETKNDPIQRSIMIRDVVKSVSLIPDVIKRSIYIQEMSHVLRMEEPVLVAEVNKAVKEDLKRQARDFDRSNREKSRRDRRNTEVKQSRETSHPPASEDNSFPTEEPPNTTTDADGPTVEPVPLFESGTANYANEFQEKDLMRILVNHGDKRVGKNPEDQLVAEYIFQNIADIIHLFENPLYIRILKLYEDALSQGQIVSHKDLVQMDDDEIRNFTIESIHSPYEYSNWDGNDYPLQTQVHPDDNFVNDSYGAIMRLKLHKIVGQIKKNQEEINRLSAAGEMEQLKIKVKTHFQLLKLRTEITSIFKSVLLG